MNKKCNRCGEVKPLENFMKNPKMADGRLHQCFVCVMKARKRFYKKNIQKFIEARKKLYWSNREDAIKKSIEWGRKNKDKRKIIRKRWSIQNTLPKAVMNKNWNARKQGAKGSFTLEEYKNKLAIHNNKCGYCLVGDAYTVDHIVPISKGGTNFISNIMPCCLKCNGQKRDYLLNEWYKLPKCYCKNR